MYNFTKRNVINLLFAMTRVTFIVITIILSVSGMLRAENASSQDLKSAVISFNFKNAKLETVLRTIEKQTAFSFAYTLEVGTEVRVNLSAKGSTLYEVLKQLSAQENLRFDQVKDMIKVSRKPVSAVPGKISGKVVDQRGESLPGASVKIIAHAAGVLSQVDGSYSITAAPGVYTIEVTYISFQTKRISGIVVAEGRTTLLDIALNPSSSALKEVVVSADYKKASVEGLYARQKNNAVISDGISAEQIARTPDKNVGETLKRISGVSTMDNKYVTVRGLSERYNGASLNGQLLPSTELNRKQFSFDIIPTNMVDNVTISKTLTPDMDAEFGGGLVQVNTKEIPTENFATVTVGESFNDRTTGKDFRSMKIEGRQYFGQIPKSRYLLGKLNWESREQILNSGNFGADNRLKDPAMLANNWMPFNYKAGLSPNLQLSVGRVKEWKDNQKIGMIVSGSYRNTWQNQAIRMSRDAFDGGADKGEAFGLEGNRYGFISNLAGLAAIGYSNPHTKLAFQTLYQLSYDQQLLLGSAANGRRGDYGTADYNDVTRQTVLWQNQLKGEHNIGEKGVKLNWTLSYTRLDRQNPDNHLMQFSDLNLGKDNWKETTNFSVIEASSIGVSEGVLRSWSRAFENNFGWNQNLSVPFRFKIGQLASTNTFKVGYAGWTKKRVFWVMNTSTRIQDGIVGSQPIGELYDPQINKVQIGAGGFGDDFDRTANLHAAYGMMDNRIGEHLRLVWGLRTEYYNMNKANPIIDAFIRNESKNAANIDYSALLKREPNWNVFPSANLTYSLTPAMNVRLAYSKSIVRPDLREMAYFKQYDFELGGEYASESPILSSRINNYDFRYEWYPGAGDVIAFSLFYKKIKYPMEIYKQGTNRLYNLRNNAWATNKGIELDLRKSFAFTGIPVLRNITLTGNFTRLFAKVIPMGVGYPLVVKDGRPTLVIEEVTSEAENRPQAGASNYMGNAAIYYDTKYVSFNMNYNYVSNRTFRTSDSYEFGLFEQPLNGLDAQCAVRLMKQKAEIKLNVSNLLNTYGVVYSNTFDYDTNTRKPTTKELLYDKGTDVIDFETRPGRTYSLSFTYKF